LEAQGFLSRNPQFIEAETALTAFPPELQPVLQS
jgi:hypothetical protein